MEKNYTFRIHCDSHEVIPDVERKLDNAGFKQIRRIDDIRKPYDLEVDVKAESTNAALILKREIQNDSNYMIRSIEIAVGY